jgi:hypothetical protein
MTAAKIDVHVADFLASTRLPWLLPLSLAVGGAREQITGRGVQLVPVLQIRHWTHKT